ncbi:hypothetical protein QBC40DRAFT_327341, partial [Triangularia verruculosa]
TCTEVSALLCSRKTSKSVLPHTGRGKASGERQSPRCSRRMRSKQTSSKPLSIVVSVLVRIETCCRQRTLHRCIDNSAAISGRPYLVDRWSHWDPFGRHGQRSIVCGKKKCGRTILANPQTGRRTASNRHWTQNENTNSSACMRGYHAHNCDRWHFVSSALRRLDDACATKITPRTRTWPEIYAWKSELSCSYQDRPAPIQAPRCHSGLIGREILHIERLKHLTPVSWVMARWWKLS